ncbi:MAG: hypothetical protein IKW83_03075 [Muribaculaceae bacterium]|nr:hypothetical protein [Muribaculaceae bacterium]
MKKIFFAFMLLLASVVAVNAQSLTGKVWFTNSSIDQNESSFVLFFEDDGTCVVAVASDQVMNEGGMKMTISVTAKVNGTYTLNGKDLKMKLDNENVDFTVDYDIEGVDASTKKMMDSMIKPELEKQKPMLKNEVLKSIPDMGNLTVVTLSNDELVLANEDGEELTFNPVLDE